MAGAIFPPVACDPPRCASDQLLVTLRTAIFPPVACDPTEVLLPGAFCMGGAIFPLLRTSCL